ncbi:MAG: hypothetical protein N2Z64_08325 [Dictyoglomus thermophilum]|uniref:DUF3187 family protein n=1 Tax=Dictyoglomus thermophilum TaxID=14 RepID=A0A7V3ZJY7_DICTH|nr:hypothetical protein [Dictyoglomus thermophilum]MCX7721267.1 hypothetical protein [Dictyoglomus thermophilum]TYT22866.1 hypothetical protein FY122_05040 [Dictyoglomus thermophilum]
MRKTILIFIVLIFIVSPAFSQEWGNLEISTEVNSVYGQDYIFSVEKWWSENLGAGLSLFYNPNSVFSYKIFLQTLYIKFIYGKFYPYLNLMTENLELKGHQISFYLYNNEIFYLSGYGARKFFDLPYYYHLPNEIPLKILGWNSKITDNKYINLSLTSINDGQENYLIDISLLNKANLPLGNINIIQNASLYLKDSVIYGSILNSASLSLGSLSIKGLLGYLNPNTPSFCIFDPGDIGGIISLSLPLSSTIFPEYMLGYFYNFKDSEHKFNLGINLTCNLSNYLSLSSSIRYVLSSKNNNWSYMQLALNFPTLQGTMWNSIYLKYEKNTTQENTSLGLKITYQF